MTILLSLGRVFQLHTLCWLQAPFRDMGQNPALRRSVDSATCGPQRKQSLGLKSAKSLQTALRGPPSQQLRRPATRRPALAGFCGSSQHFRAARRLPSSSQHFRVARRPTNRRLSGQCHCPGFRIATRRPTNRLTTRRPFPNSSQAHKSLSYSQATSE